MISVKKFFYSEHVHYEITNFHRRVESAPMMNATSSFINKVQLTSEAVKHKPIVKQNPNHKNE